MILSLSLIFAVAIWNVHPLVLFFLLITWIPDIVLMGVIKDLLDE